MKRPKRYIYKKLFQKIWLKKQNYLIALIIVGGIFLISIKVPRIIVEGSSESLSVSDVYSTNQWGDVIIENIQEKDDKFIKTSAGSQLLALKINGPVKCENSIESVSVKAYVYSTLENQKISLGINDKLWGNEEETSHKEGKFSLHSFRSEKKEDNTSWTCNDFKNFFITLKTNDAGFENSEWRVDKVWVEIEYTAREPIIDQKGYRWQYKIDAVDEAIKENYPLYSVNPGMYLFLRVELYNSGDFESTNQNYKLQYSEKTSSSCNSIKDWSNVDAVSSISLIENMDDSILSSEIYPNSSCVDETCSNFIESSWAGKHTRVTLPSNNFTELGFVLDTVNAKYDTTYCFRVVVNKDETSFEEISGKYEIFPEVTLAGSSENNFKKELKVSDLPEIKSTKKDFLSFETPNFELDYFEILQTESYTDNIIEKERIFEEGNFKITAEVYDSNYTKVDIIPKIIFLPDGHTFVELQEQNNMKPGRYTLEINTEEKDYANIPLSQDFTWGVLAINTNKPTYLLNEKANILMTVLDSNGRTVCDGDVKLEIKAPSGKIYKYSTEKETIEKSKECGPSNVTYIPDYSVNFENTNEAGTYEMSISSTIGDEERMLTDKFKVSESIDFDIERVGPVRIYPIEKYDMKIKIISNIDYFGKIEERVPSIFEIENLGTEFPNNFEIIESNDVKIISWQVSLKKGDTIELSYKFDAPDISPEFYLLGPISIGDFEEQRQWQIASDETGVQVPSRLWMTGFELNTTTADVEYTANVGSPSISNTTYRSGSYALRANPSNATAGASNDFQSANSANPFYIRTYIYVTTTPDAQVDIMILRDAAATDQISIRLNTDMTLTLYNDEDSEQIGNASSAVSASTWTRIEVYYNFGSGGAANTVVRSRLEGVSFAYSATVNHANGVMTYQVGSLSTNSTSDLFFDDLAVNTTGTGTIANWPGEGKIVYLRPDGNGTNTTWTGDYTSVYEVTPDDASSYIYCAGSDELEDYTLEDITSKGVSTNDKIRVMQIYARAGGGASAAGRNYNVILRDVSNAYDIQNVSMETTAWFTVDDNKPRNPITTVAATGRVNQGMVAYDVAGDKTDPFTPTDVNNYYVRISTSDCDPVMNISTVWVEVEYQAATGGRLFSSGFELQSTTANVEWLSVYNSSISTTVYHGGNASLQIASLASGTPEGVSINIKSSNSDGPFYMRTYIRIVTAPSAENRIFKYRSTTNVYMVYVTLDNNRQLRLYDEDGSIGSASSALDLLRWYRLEVKFDASGGVSADSAEAKIDGSSFASSSTRDFSSGIMRLDFNGNGNAEEQTVGEWYFDDVAVNENIGTTQNGYPGAGYIVHLKPNAAGESSQWANSGGPSNNYECLDETTPNDVTDYVYTSNVGYFTAVNITDTSTAGITSGSTISLVQVGIRFTESAATQSGVTLGVSDDTTTNPYQESESLDITTTTWYTNSTTSVVPYYLIGYTRPYVSSSWTTSTLDTSQIAVRLSDDGDTQSMRVSTLWMLVDYIPSPNTAPNDPSSLAQLKTDDTVIALGDWTSETSVKFSAYASDTDIGDTLYLCIEKDELGTPFLDTEDSCGSGVEYPGGDPVNVTHTITSLTPGSQYHWQARVRDEANTYSNWIQFGSNSESIRDFGVDNSNPGAGTVYDGGTIGSDIDENTGSLTTVLGNWSGFSDSQSGIKSYEYAIGTTSGGTDIVNWKAKSEPGNIFSNEFESGDLTGWDSNSNDGGNLSSTNASAYVGIWGMAALINDGNSIYVEDDFGAAGTYYARFYLNPNSLTMTSGDIFTITDIRSSTTIRASIELNYDGANYRVRGVLETGPVTTSWVNISSSSFSSIEIMWFANASGYVSLWVDGVQYTTTTGDTSGLTVDNIQLGMVSDRDAGTSGTFYIDKFTSDNTDYNGPLTYFTETITTAGHLHTGQSYFVGVRAINNAESTGSGANSDGFRVLPTLTFSVDSNSIVFVELNEVNFWTDLLQSTLFTTSTNAYNGYIVTGWLSEALTHTENVSFTIKNYESPNSDPTTWTGTGFGYTTDDDVLSGGTADRFTNGGPKYAGFTTSGSGKPCADHTTQITGQTGAVSGENITITYRITVDSSQKAGRYETNIIYIITPTF